MHIDENKKFDKRAIDPRIREGSISQKEYEEYLANLPDVSEKVEESGGDMGVKRRGGGTGGGT